MRRTKRRIKQQKRKDTTIWLLTFFVVAPIIAVLLGYGVVKHVILPQFSGVNDSEPINNGQDALDTDIDSWQENEGEPSNPSPEASGEGTFELRRDKINLYNIQVGSFSSLSNAQELIEEMKGKDLGGYIIKTDNYKVIAYTLGSHSQADIILSDVREHYKDAFISSLPIEEATVTYIEEESQYIDSVASLMDQIREAYIEELKTWKEAINNNTKDTIRGVMEENTETIEEKFNQIKSYGKSEGLKSTLNNMNTHVEDRKDMLADIEEQGSQLTALYSRYNQSFFNYLLRNN